MEVEETELDEVRSDEPQPGEGETANGEANPSDDDDDMDLANFKATSSSSAPAKKRKMGIIYISNIPKHMNVTRLREILGEYGAIGRVYLQPEKLSSEWTKWHTYKTH